MTGTKDGCGVAACGACTGRVDGQAVRSCVTPRRACRSGRSRPSKALERPASRILSRQRGAEQVPQCGYCQRGMLTAVTALLEKKPTPIDAGIDAAISNLCRCGTYQRVGLAIHRAAGARMPTAVPAPGKQAHPHTAARVLSGRTRAGITSLRTAKNLCHNRRLSSSRAARRTARQRAVVAGGKSQRLLTGTKKSVYNSRLC